MKTFFAQIAAVALTALKTAARSGLLFAPFVAWLICVAGLPQILKTDGTAEGAAGLLFQYALGSVSLLLLITALLGGAAAISLDIRRRVIQTVVTKPVSMSAYWLGKWTALMLVGLGLLVPAGMLVLGQLNLITAKLTPATADDPHSVYLDVAPVNHSNGDKNTTSVIAAGGLARWTIPPLPDGKPILLEFKTHTARAAAEPPELQWRLRGAARPEWLYLATVLRPGQEQRLRLPPTTGLEKGGWLEAANPGNAGALVFEPGNLRLRIRVGSQAGNLARALLLEGLRLAAAAALGLTLGVFLSFPVAAFTSGTWLLMMGLLLTVPANEMQNWITVMAAHADPSGLWRLLLLLNRAATGMTRPLQGYGGLAALIDRHWIGWEVIQPALLESALWVALALWIGVCGLRKREIGKS